MMRHYHSRAHYIDLSATSPLWPGSLILASLLVLVAILLEQELPAAVALTQAINKSSRSCPGFNPEIAPSSPFVDAIPLNVASSTPEPANPIPDAQPPNLDDHPDSALLPPLAEHRASTLRDRTSWRIIRRKPHGRSPRS